MRISSKNRYRKNLILTAAVMLFIFVQSAFPADLSGQESGIIVSWIVHLFHSDPDTTVLAVRKAAHFTEYFVLGICLANTLISRKHQIYPEPDEHLLTSADHLRRVSFPIAGAAWLFGTIYAVTDELHQMFVPGRSGEIRDVLIDSLGVLAGIVVVCLINRLRKSFEMRRTKEMNRMIKNLKDIYK